MQQHTSTYFIIWRTARTYIYSWIWPFVYVYIYIISIDVVDALEIDWASLNRDTLPKAPRTMSALKRFTPAAIFSRIGISRAFAGDELLETLKNVCQKQLDEEFEGKAKTCDTNLTIVWRKAIKHTHQRLTNSKVESKHKPKIFDIFHTFSRSPCWFQY